MPAIPINIGPITGDTVSAVSVITLVRGDTNGSIPGVSLPIALTLSSGTWSGSFNDATPSPYYFITYTVTFSDASVYGPFGDTVSGLTGSVTGFWTSQTLITRYMGQTLGGQLSNLDNALSGSDPAGFSDAITHAENWINYQLALYGYPNGATTPAFPKTSLAYGVLSDSATILAAYWLYAKRGVEDDAKGIAGKFEGLKNEAESRVKRILHDKIPDVARSFNSRPALITQGYVGPTSIPVSTIPVVP